jgi:opacity protein-like surface antigen
MSRLSTFVLAGTALAASQAAVLAADMPRPGGSQPPPPVVSASAGWYLRGDIGYGWGRLDGSETTAPFANPTSSSLDSTFLGGVGAGYKSSWLRTDVTVDYRVPFKYEGTGATPGDVSARISAASALFNAYFDFDTWHSLTPYVGGGAGASYVRVYDYVSAVTPPFSGDTSHTQWNFTWAVMAGVGYTLAPNLMVDLGYRYIDFGDVRTAEDISGQTTFKNVAAHEVRLGLRWSFDDGLANY